MLPGFAQKKSVNNNQSIFTSSEKVEKERDSSLSGIFVSHEKVEKERDPVFAGIYSADIHNRISGSLDSQETGVVASTNSSSTSQDEGLKPPPICKTPKFNRNNLELMPIDPRLNKPCAKTDGGVVSRKDKTQISNNYEKEDPKQIKLAPIDIKTKMFEAIRTDCGRQRFKQRIKCTTNTNTFRKLNNEGLPNVAFTPKKNKLKPDNTTDDDNHIWLPKVEPGGDIIKIASYTPLGNIAIVPTSRKVPPTPNRQTQLLRKEKVHECDNIKDDTIKNDPIINATIILDCTKPEDRPYDYVSKRMKSIMSITVALKDYHKNNLKECPAISGKVSADQFDECLSIYENNQVYYQECLENGSLSSEQVKEKLSKLEYWFMGIIEPCPLDDDKYCIDMWKSREQSKNTNGYTAYCDPELQQYIVPLSKFS